jgi:hypothetical protein
MEGRKSPCHHSIENITTLWAQGRRIPYAADLNFKTEHNQSTNQVMETYKYYYIYTRNKLYWTDQINDDVIGHTAGMGGKAHTITYGLKNLK